MTMKRINLYLPEEQLEALEAERVRLGIPVAEQIRRAINVEIKERVQRSELNERASPKI